MISTPQSELLNLNNVVTKEYVIASITFTTATANHHDMTEQEPNTIGFDTRSSHTDDPLRHREIFAMNLKRSKKNALSYARPEMTPLQRLTRVFFKSLVTFLI